MFALISPAKKLDFESKWDLKNYKSPDFLDQSKILIDRVKKLSQNKLQSLMKLSDKLGELNYNRYQSFSVPFTKLNARPAIAAFRGDTYIGLDADTLLSDDMVYAQNHLGILSGLYGLLGPLDLMQAYRLEMGTKLTNLRGRDLYDFWGDLITEACNNAVKDHKDKTIISLASNEYIKAIEPKGLNSAFITCYFKELKGEEVKTVGLFAKRARGMMARFIIKKRIESPEGLKDFKESGYEFIDSLSDEENYIFLRSNS